MRLRVITAALLAAALVPPAAQAASRPTGHVGRWFTDHHGRVLTPHGVAVMDFADPHLPEALGFSDDDARFLADHGFDVVRVGMNWSGIEPQRDQISGSYLASIRRTVRLLARRGIKSILDIHQDGYGPMTGTDGAPDWATVTDGAPNNKVAFGADYFVNPALERAFDNLWSNGAGMADQFAEMVAALGRTFRDEPGMVGYDLFNEPWPGSQYSSCMSPQGCPVFDQLLSAWYRRVIAALKRTDPRHLAFVEPNLFFDFGANTNLGDTGGDGFAFHDYCLGAGAGDALPTVPNNGTPCGIEESMVIANATAFAEKAGLAVINTEWAATDDLVTTARVADELDAGRVPWTFWEYASPRLVADPHKPPKGENLNAPALAILDRPYPRAVAGVPRRWKWDAQSRTFELDYTTALAAPSESPSRTTTVWTSPLHYPRGYKVAVDGARVISRPNARVLRLRTLPRSGHVELRLTPR